jgi:hypothetical protein
MTALSSALHRFESGYIVLTGSPGSGKSTLLTRLLRADDRLAATTRTFQARRRVWVTGLSVSLGATPGSVKFTSGTGPTNITLTEWWGSVTPIWLVHRVGIIPRGRATYRQAALPRLERGGLTPSGCRVPVLLPVVVPVEPPIFS